MKKVNLVLVTWVVAPVGNIYKQSGAQGQKAPYAPELLKTIGDGSLQAECGVAIS